MPVVTGWSLHSTVSGRPTFTEIKDIVIGLLPERQEYRRM
jgi:hypothetical protein